MKHRSIHGHESTQFISLNHHLCRACWKCIETCPQGVFGKIEVLFHKHSHIEHPEKCLGCLKCVKVCPRQAISNVLLPRV